MRNEWFKNGINHLVPLENALSIIFFEEIQNNFKRPKQARSSEWKLFRKS